MKRAPTLPARFSSRRRCSAAIAGAIAVALALGACSGGEDEPSGAGETTTPRATQPVPTNTTTTAPPITLATTTTLPPVDYVTEGAAVIVANASRINGAAGRLTERLAAVGFSTVAPTNSSEGQLDVTTIYYAASDPAAEAVASSLREAFGGGAQLAELGVPAPVETGEIGLATVLVAMGNDIADKTLDEMQGRAPATTTTVAGTTTTIGVTTTTLVSTTDG